jgi:hypothetical protein
MTSEPQTEHTDTRPCPFKKKAGRRPALQIQAEHQMTSESQTEYTDTRPCSFKEKAGRRPALQIQAEHEMTSESQTEYTDNRHMAHCGRPYNYRPSTR